MSHSNILCEPELTVVGVYPMDMSPYSSYLLPKCFHLGYLYQWEMVLDSQYLT